MLFRIEQRYTVHDYFAAVRPFDTGDALEGHAFSAAGGPQQRQHLISGLELHLEPEGAQALFNIDIYAHHAPPFPEALLLPEDFFSSMLTASSTTKDIAMFTSTQRKASASSLVRQS